MPPELARLAEASPQGYVRALVELRAQVDLPRLMAEHEARDLSRAEARSESLEALERVSAEGREKLAPLLDARLIEGTVDYWQMLRFRNRVHVSARLEVFETLRAHPAVAAILPEYDGVREARARENATEEDGEMPAGPGQGDNTRVVAKARPLPPGDSWGIEALGLRKLWEEGVDGRGTVIGILDSGVIGRHHAFAGAEREGAFWYDPVRGRADPIDTVPHGSQVLACALGREVEDRAIGAAPGARWAAALANQFNSYNNVNMSLSADWLIFEVGPEVVLGAWGHGSASCDARDIPMIDAFRATGTVPVFAAGNDGPDPATVQAPAGLGGWYPEKGGPLAVAAINRDIAIIPESSRGPSRCPGGRAAPDVAAPGFEVPAPTAGGDSALTLASGTSMAVGWVGGVAAMMMQVNPELRVPEVEAIIRETARDLPPAGFDDASGHGLIDPAAAVEAARRAR